MKKGLIIAGVVVVLAAVLWGSLAGKRGGKGVGVYAEEARSQPISRIVRATGQIDPRVKVDISAHVVARIVRLHVREGQEIEAGDPFIELEREAFQASYDRTTAQLEMAQAQRRQAQVDLEDAVVQLRRAEQLATDSIVAPDRLDAARLRERSASIAVEQANEAIGQARADLARTRDDLRKTTIYSPLSGRVVALNAEEGEVVVSGTMNNPASVIGTVADLSELLAEVAVDETEIVDVQLAHGATVRVDAVPDASWEGTVVEIGSSGYQTPQQPDVTFFRVKILLDEPDPRLRPGMSARAEIGVARHEEAVVVPIQSVVYRRPLGAPAGEADNEIQVVFVVEDGKAIQRPVEVGISTVTHAEILSGVEAGETVVTGPSRRLKELEHDAAVEVTASRDRADEAEDEEEEED